MAILHYDCVAVENVSYGLADALYKVARKYTNRFSHEAGSNIITFDNCQINFDGNKVGVKSGDTIYYDITTAYDGCYYSPIYVTTWFTENVFYFELQWVWSADNSVAKFMFISKDEHKILGVTTSNSSRDILDGTYMDLVSCDDITFKPQRMLFIERGQYGYGLIPANVLFVDKTLFSNSSGDYFMLDDLKCCSYVPLNSTPTINGKNYLAISSYMLIELDS